MMDDNELQRALGRVEGKLDALIASSNSRDTRVDEIEKDVLSLTKKVWYMFGVTNVVSLILAYLPKWH